MINYLLEASICLGSLYLLYFFLLRDNKFFDWQRAFLLLSVLASLLIPVLEFDRYEPVAEQLTTFNEALLYLKIPQDTTPVAREFDWNQFMVAIYFLGLIVFFIRFVIGAGRLLKLIKSCEAKNEGDYTLLYTDEPVFAASFFKYIFIENYAVRDEESYQYLLLHEKKHIRDLHFLDLIFMEMMKIIFWFNPFIYLTGKSLRSVHEFTCDEEVVKHSSAEKYEKLLIRSFFTQAGVPLMSQFSETSIKNRIIMMNKKNSKRLKKLKFLAVVPLMLLLVYACNNEESGVNQTISTSFSGVVTGENGQPLPGVNVVLVGTQTGSVTDLDGKYKIDNSQAKAESVTFSFIGMESITENIDGRAVIDVSLVESDNNQELQEFPAFTKDFTFNDQKKITGQVFDQKGFVMEGVEIRIPGTDMKAVSDADGKYTIAVPDKGGMVIYTYDSKIRNMVVLKGQSVLDVEIKND